MRNGVKRVALTSWCIELALRTILTTSLREGDAAAVGGHHTEVGHSQAVSMQRGQSQVTELGDGRRRADRSEDGGNKVYFHSYPHIYALDHHLDHH